MKIIIPEEVKVAVEREDAIKNSKKWYKMLQKMVAGKPFFIVDFQIK